MFNNTLLYSKCPLAENMIGEIHYFIHTVYWFGAKAFRAQSKLHYVHFLCLSGIHIYNKYMKTYSILSVGNLKNIRGLQIHSTII